MKSLPAGFFVNESTDSSQLPEGFTVSETQEEIVPRQLTQQMPQGFNDNQQKGWIARQEQARADELPELSGILAGESNAKSIALAPILLTTTNPFEMGQILSSNFPNIGISQQKNGEVFATNNETGVVVSLNKPGLSSVDVVQGLGLMAAFFPTARATTAATGTLKKMGVGGLAAGGIQSGMEAAQTIAGGEFDVGDVALSTAFGGAAEGVMPLAGAVKGALKRKPKVVDDALTPEFIAAQEAQQGLKAATDIDVPLYPAQKANDESLLQQQRYLRQAPSGAKQAAIALQKQDDDLFEATQRLINSVADESAVDSGSFRFFDASKKALDDADLARKELASPAYKRAFQESLDIDEIRRRAIAATDTFISGHSDTPLKKQLQSVRSSIETATDLKQLHGAKENMDVMIDRFQEMSLGRHGRREVAAIRKIMNDGMEEVSPIYAQGNRIFQTATEEAYKPLQNSVVGQVSRMNESNLDAIATKIFSKQRTPQSIENAKKVIKSVDPEAWDEIVRVELQNRLGGFSALAKEAGADAVPNMAGGIKRGLFGTPAQRSVFMRALNPEQQKNFRFLETVLDRAQSGRATGSPTNSFGYIERLLRGSKNLAVKGWQFATKPKEQLAELGQEQLQERNTKVLAEAMFNPAWSGRMNELLGKNPNKKKTIDKLDEFFKDVSDSLPDSAKDVAGEAGKLAKTATQLTDEASEIASQESALEDEEIRIQNLEKGGRY